MLSTVGSLLCSRLVLTGKGACDKLKIDAYAEKRQHRTWESGTGKELKPEIAQVWRLSLPAILTQITTIVMQYIDSAMVGALGANASASIGLVSTSTWLLMNGITSAVSAGFSVQVAHHIGAGKEDEARNVVRNGMVAALIVSGLLCLTGVGLSPHLPGWLGGAQEICADASAYFYGVCADGAVFTAQFALFGVFAVQRRYGHAQRAQCGDACWTWCSTRFSFRTLA